METALSDPNSGTKVALGETPVLQKKTNHGNGIGPRNRIIRFLVPLDQKRQKLDGVLFRTGGMVENRQAKQRVCVGFELLVIVDEVGSPFRDHLVVASFEAVSAHSLYGSTTLRQPLRHECPPE